MADKSTPFTRAMGAATGLCNRLNAELSMNQIDDPFWQPSQTIHYVAGKSGKVGSQMAALQGLSGDADMADSLCLFNGNMWVPSALGTGGPIFLCKCCETYDEVLIDYSSRPDISYLSIRKIMLFNYETAQVVDDDGSSIANPKFTVQQGLYYDNATSATGDNGETIHLVGLGYDDYFVPDCSPYDLTFVKSYGCSLYSVVYDMSPDVGWDRDFTLTHSLYDFDVKDVRSYKTVGCAVDKENNKSSSILSISEAGVYKNVKLTLLNQGVTPVTISPKIGTKIFDGIEQDINDKDYYSIFVIKAAYVPDTGIFRIRHGGGIERYAEFSPTIDGDLWQYPGGTPAVLTPRGWTELAIEIGSGYDAYTDCVFPGTPFCVYTGTNYESLMQTFYYPRSDNPNYPEERESFEKMTDPGYVYPIKLSYDNFFVSSEQTAHHLVTTTGESIKTCFNFFSDRSTISFSLNKPGGYLMPMILIVKGVISPGLLGLGNEDFTALSYGLSCLEFYNP